jgi:hypothetical protein
MGGEQLNQNIVGQLGTDAQARIANQAYEIRMAAQQPDGLLLAQSQFAEAVRDLWGGGKLLDANRGPGHHTAERTELSLLAAFGMRA